MGLVNKILQSKLFKKTVFTSGAFIVILIISNLVFDRSWKHKYMMPLTNLEEAYAVPLQYDNIPRVNLKILSSGFLGIEGNRTFTTLGSNEAYTYFDSVEIKRPDTAFSYYNKIYLKFKNSNNIDSIYYVVSHSLDSNIFWNQIFYSSVKVQHLNELSCNPESFRLDSTKLVNRDLLASNATLISQAINYFNTNEKSLGLAECETDSKIFKTVCTKYSVPCKIIFLQGGNSRESGFGNKVIGYPQHVVCEIYSSRFKKWFVVDPFYGTVFFGKDSVPLNAAEISNVIFFEKDSIFQDSVLTTFRDILDKDYFNYYMNVFYVTGRIPNIIVRQFVKFFYNRYDYLKLHYSGEIPDNMNAISYIEKKTIMYLIIIIIYTLVVIAIIANRLYVIRKQNTIN